MPRHRAVARQPDTPIRLPPIDHDPAGVASRLEDASHTGGGHARGLASPASEGEVCALLRQGDTVLPIGAQSSVTGGATPFGELLLSTARLRRVGPIVADAMENTGRRGHGCVRVGAGVALADLEAALRAAGWTYPPAPTWTAATVGGIVATNAAGPATFKHGVTRDWVAGLTVVLPCGEVLDLRRGEVVASGDGRLEIDTATSGTIGLAIAPLSWPDVPKRSAGYALVPGMDLVDLFVGAEGTLGVVTGVSLRVARLDKTRARAMVPCPTTEDALAFVGRLRDRSHETWRSGDPLGIDVAAVEHLDARSLAIVREDGVDRRQHVTLPAAARVLLFVDLDLPVALTREVAWGQVEMALDARAPDAPLVRFCRLAHEHGLLDDIELALPGEAARVAQMEAIREAVPAGVNARVADARARHGPEVKKTAADMIVPWPRFPEMLRTCEHLLEARGLDYAIWGHVSDGNVHPNVLPRAAGDVAAGVDAILALGRAVIGMGGCPLAEHGVGRHPLKKQLLRLLHGEAGVAAMRAVKRALDPAGRLAPGVLF